MDWTVLLSNTVVVLEFHCQLHCVLSNTAVLVFDFVLDYVNEQYRGSGVPLWT